jgi:hypothetical protein
MLGVYVHRHLPELPLPGTELLHMGVLDQAGLGRHQPGVRCQVWHGPVTPYV